MARSGVGFMAGVVVGVIVMARLGPREGESALHEPEASSRLYPINQTGSNTSHSSSPSMAAEVLDAESAQNKSLPLDKTRLTTLLANSWMRPGLKSFSRLLQDHDVRACISSITKGYWLADVFVSQSPLKCGFRMFDWRQAHEIMNGKHLSLNGDSLTRRLTNTFDVLLSSQKGFRSIANSKLSTGWHDQLHREYKQRNRSSSLHFFWNEGVYVHGPGKCHVVRRAGEAYTQVMLGYGLHHVIDHGSRCVGECPDRFVLCLQTAVCDLCSMGKTPHGIWRTAPYSSGSNIVPAIRAVNNIAKSLLFVNGSVWESAKIASWKASPSITSFGVSRQTADRAVRAMQACCGERGRSKRKLNIYLLDHEQLLLDRSQGSNRITGDTENHFGDAARVAEVQTLLNLLRLIDLDER
ncbi:hypothetical protein GUITHDRAFT_105594 [Guillardia theta CCMP2712]|uniref:Uncharacterized protein n=1 Tax=Guillardia theta (strain CCMP2712) TaxID=905079 RepID=L1JJG0_GUITC|nr:hypothetical protein GUITHDRAFT_105594 [Guillardia theta CCMP2712]EKX48447.1 hypothetical protein GUITHDRAFT_105594 [Guillardia theta CCMP2712]|eukprot:XP_005835427.1 hypothetical protein GUITHDRAFT_105594 [Guillardia theta CCMP2712]